jgi:hypothetical protein
MSRVITVFICLLFVHPLFGQLVEWTTASTSTDDTENAFPITMDVDSHGNTYVVGYFFGTMHIQHLALTSLHDYDGFIAKFNTTGVLLWCKPVYSEGRTFMRDIKVDRDGNVVVTVKLTGTGNFLGAVAKDWTLAKVDPNGNVIWLKDVTTNAQQLAGSLMIDSQNNIYVSESRSDNMQTAKLNASGNEQWRRQMNNFGCCIQMINPALALDQNENLIVATKFYGSLQFGSQLFSSEGENLLVARYLKDGTESEALHSEGYNWHSTVHAVSASVDASNNIFITGVIVDGRHRGFCKHCRRIDSCAWR